MRSSIVFFALLALATAWPRQGMQLNLKEQLLSNVMRHFIDAQIEGENPSELPNVEIQEKKKTLYSTQGYQLLKVILQILSNKLHWGSRKAQRDSQKCTFLI